MTGDAAEKAYVQIDAGRVPIKAWIKGVPFEEEAAKQLRNAASLPFIYKWIAAMPDVHWGLGSTVGSVIPTKGAIVPAAVGVDIGCGMAALRTSLQASDLPDDLKAEVFKGHVFSLVSYHWWQSKRFILEDTGTAPLGAAKFPLRREGGDGRYWGPELKALMRGHYATGTVGLGGMGIDSAEGRVTLDRKGRAQLEWTGSLVPGDRTFELIEGIRAACRMVAEAGGGELLHEKEWSDDRRMLGVHPLGGCRIAEVV